MNDPAQPLLSLAREHLTRNDHVAAETLLREVVRQDPERAEAHRLLGLVAHARGDLRGAMTSFQRANALEPSPEVAVLLAITCNELGLYSDARKAVSSAAPEAAADPRIPPYAHEHLARLHAETALAYEKLSVFATAVEEYRKALSLCPDRTDLRTRLGVVLRGAGDLDGARRELEAAASAQPAHAPAHLALGLTYFRLGMRDEAASQWRAALAVDPELRPAKVYLRMLDGELEHMPSMVPDAPDDDEFGDLKISVISEA